MLRGPAFHIIVYFLQYQSHDFMIPFVHLHILSLVTTMRVPLANRFSIHMLALGRRISPTSPHYCQKMYLLANLREPAAAPQH